jgi:phage shock protein PspC (stress-responsive transcriptional regulator)
MYKFVGAGGASLLAAGIGRALDPPPSHTSITTVLMVLFGAAIIGWIIGALADEI